MVEADESDRSLLKLAPQDRGAHQRRARPPRDLRVAARRRRARFREFLGARRARGGLGPAGAASRCADGTAVGRSTPSPGARAGRLALRARRRRRSQLTVPGAHNALNAAAALTACRARGADVAAPPRPRCATSRRRPALRAPRHARPRARSSSTTTPTTRPRCARRSRPPARWTPRRVVAVFQPHLYSRTAAPGARVRRRARARRPRRSCSTIYPARERAEDFPGVTGRLVAEAAADAGGGQARRVAARPRRRRALPARRAARGRPAADARGGRRRRARAGGWPVRGRTPGGVKKILAGRASSAVCALAGGWLGSATPRVVQVRDVFDHRRQHLRRARRSATRSRPPRST